MKKLWQRYKDGDPEVVLGVAVLFLIVGLALGRLAAEVFG